MEVRWSDGQIELFQALGKICERVGKNGADELLGKGSNGEGLKALDTRAFVVELRELRERAGLVDGLQKENLRLRVELEDALGKLDLSNARTAIRREKSEEGAIYQSSSVQTVPEVAEEPDGERSSRINCLIRKHDVLTRNYKELVLARKTLEDKLRSSVKLSNEWVEYANALEKRIGKLETKLTSHGVPLNGRSPRLSAARIPPSGPSGLPGAMSVGTPDNSVGALSCELPNFLHMSERVSELARDTKDGLVGWQPQNSEQRIPGGLSKLQSYISARTDPLLSTAKPEPQLQLDISESLEKGSMVSPKPFTDNAILPAEDVFDSLKPHHSSTTEEVPDASEIISNCELVDVSPLIIEGDLSPEIPIVISSRNIKKRKNQIETGSNANAPSTKVKVEVITSSPIGLAGIQNFFPEESLDLDEMGEKMNTPKKRRQIKQSAHSYINRTAYSQPGIQDHDDQVSTGLVRVIGQHQGERKAQPKGRPSALQPGSPNKMILPRTSSKHGEYKRRRLEHSIRGAVILAEDGENNMSLNVVSEDRGYTSTDAAELERRLSSLLEQPAPEKADLTPAKPLIVDTSTTGLRARAASLQKTEGTVNSVRRQAAAVLAPNVLAVPVNMPDIGYRTVTSKKRTSRIPEDADSLEAEVPDQKPFRARPLHQLGLEHFKINPRYNQGSDYAYSEVVRGRESRRCLSGCTKPECCGDKFRKIVESLRAQEERSLSQQEEEERLLEEYLGDNKGKLRNMTTEEKEELLIQAKTRELANKTGKHRHAYERRRSPPGFWRSDFPNTQELQMDRHQAARIERDLVQQRYDEAMRPGGKWLFRDE